MCLAALLTSQTADAFCLRDFANNGGSTWQTFPIKYKISNNLTDAQILPAIDLAFASWASVPCATLQFENAGTFDPAETAFGTATDEAIYIYWFDQADGFPVQSQFAVHIVPRQQSEGITGGSVAINAFSQQWSGATVPPATAIDVRGEMTGIIGELLGLTVSNTIDSVMRQLILFGSVANRTLKQDDIDAIQFLYPSSVGTDCPVDVSQIQIGADGCSSLLAAPDSGSPAMDAGTGAADAMVDATIDDAAVDGDAGGPRRCFTREQCILGERCTLEGFCEPIPNPSGCCRVSSSAGENAGAALLFLLGVMVHFVLRKKRKKGSGPQHGEL